MTKKKRVVTELHVLYRLTKGAVADICTDRFSLMENEVAARQKRGSALSATQRTLNGVILKLYNLVAILVKIH